MASEPVGLDPFQTIVNVGWGGIKVLVLAVIVGIGELDLASGEDRIGLGEIGRAIGRPDLEPGVDRARERREIRRGALAAELREG